MENRTEERLYSQNQIADILGISKGTFSRWLRENSVSPKQMRGQRKFYDKTVIEQYKKAKEEHDVKDHVGSTKLSTVQLLQATVTDKQKEIDYLRKQLEEKEKQLKEKDRTIADFGAKFAKLADQAQQLNLTDKDPERVKKLQNSDPETQKEDKKTVATETATVKKHWWSKLF